MEEGKHNANSFHLAGIVPVAEQPRDFNFPWLDSLMPLAEDFLAVENSVVECAMAGCETIWIVCHKNTQPLIRHRIGEWVEDPAFLGRMDRYPSESRRQIPIYYIPIHPKDRDKRDCLGWSALYGALSAYHITRKISKWVIPDRYYVSFPYGVFDLQQLRKFRKKISNKNNFYLSYDGKTVKDGHFLSFTFSGEDFKRFRRELKKEATTIYFKGTKEKLPLSERYSARYFSLDKVFKSAIIGDTDVVINLDWHYNIGCWEDYCVFLGSEHRKLIKRPSYLKYHEWNPIGYEEEEDDGGDEI
jgi:hypothetical protein